VLPKVYERFVRTGKVELLYLDLPLQMHPHAFKAAEAAACAGDQGKFWEMHHQLFADQRALGASQLPTHAEEIGLDLAAFQKCLAGGKHAGGIREDIRLANSLGISGTPAFILGRRIPGSDKVQVAEVVKGLPPFEFLEEKLNTLLAAK
jgi:protein-disulfide isomerase